MDTETKARIVEEGGKVVGDLIKAIALRPRKPPEAAKGTCYEDAWRFLMKLEEGELIHGSVTGADGRTVEHAWVELPSGYVWEPQTKSVFKKSVFEEAFKPTEDARYTVEEAAIMAVKKGYHGAWARKSPEGSTPPSKIAQKAPETENVVETSHEPETPSISAPESQEPPYIAKESIKAGTACTLCSDEHLSEVSGALAEALRFARSEGLASKEVIRRIRHARDELNAMERFDLAPEEIMKLPEDEKEVAHWTLPESRNLRHMINGIQSVNDLEKTAAKAAETADAFAEKLIRCKPSYFETEQQKELPPEIEALKKMVEERKHGRG